MVSVKLFSIFSTLRIKKMFKNKRVVVTGVCGTIGQKLLEKLIDREASMPEEIIGIDNDESGLFFLDQSYSSVKHVNFSCLLYTSPSPRDRG